MRPIDADTLIPLIQEEKIEGKTLDIIKVLGDGLQAETLNQACDRHIKIISSLPTIDEHKIVVEYLKQRNLVMITAESFEVLKAHYNRINGVVDNEKNGTNK